MPSLMFVCPVVSEKLNRTYVQMYPCTHVQTKLHFVYSGHCFISQRLISPAAYKTHFSPVPIYFIYSYGKMLYFINPLAGSAGVPAEPPSVTSGLKISVQQLHPSGTCANRNQKIVLFMRIHTSCARNGDCVTSIINTGNLTNKDCCHKL